MKLDNRKQKKYKVKKRNMRLPTKLQSQMVSVIVERETPDLNR